MNNIKKIGLIASFATVASLAQAALTTTGTAFSNAVGISAGDVGVLIFDNNNTGNFTTTFNGFNFTVGASITANATYGDFTVALGTSKTATAPTQTLTTLSGAFSNVQLTNGVDIGDKFAFVVFQNSTTTILAGDTYTVWTHSSWVVPPDGNYSFAASPTGSNFQQVTAANSANLKVFTGTVVPEPSAFAALAGIAALGFAASRRRRS